MRHTFTTPLGLIVTITVPDDPDPDLLEIWTHNLGRDLDEAWRAHFDALLERLIHGDPDAPPPVGILGTSPIAHAMRNHTP